MVKKLKLGLTGLILVAMPSVWAADYNLVKDGKAASCIVLPDNAGPAEKHAADELALFLEKVTGARIAIGGAPSKELYNVYLGTTGSKNMPRSAAIDKAVAQLQDDGFALCADKDGVRVIGKKPVGVLYGAYAILKQYAGLRWFAPGAEFEYCPKNSSVAVPEQVTISNPSFKLRRLAWICANWNSKITNTWDWIVRNGMNIEMGIGQYKTADLRAELEKRGAELGNGGGHCFSTLLSDDLFDTHPEYFPQIDGKRRKQQIKGVPGWPQPCTSNPKVAEIMAGSLNKILDASPNPQGAYLIGNNDCQAWCECAECVKLDPPAEKKQGFVSTRYWTLLNKIAAEVYKTHPDAELRGWGYQNYQYPPIGIVPDPRFTVIFCAHGRCFRHTMEDLTCAANDRYREILTQWGKLKNTICVLEYLGGDCNFPAYAPIEKSFAEDLKYYKKIGLGGVEIFMVAPDSIIVKPWNTPRFQEEMLTAWQTYYIAAQLLWNVDAGYDGIYEDMGAKYYGKTWPSMRKYRALLTESFAATPGHIQGCGGTPSMVMGKCLEKPGVEAQLLQLLDEAEKLAAGDQTALQRVRRDRRYFQTYWQDMRKELLAKRQKELKVNKRADRIVVDGKLEEFDWQKTEAITGFIATDGKTMADPQTLVKILYDEDNIYLAVEAMESEPGKMTINKKERDESVWSDSSVEFFINAAGMNDKYVQLVINPKGVIYDSKAVTGNSADVAFDAQAEIKTAVLPDRWVAEIRIPAAAFGPKIKDGDIWNINVARNRRLSDGKDQGSSWCNGVYHGPDAFRPVMLGAAK